MRKNKGQAIGYALGVLVLFPLLLYGVNKLFFSTREVTEKQISEYINNSIELKDIANDNISREDIIKGEYDKSLGFHTKTITHFLSRRGRGQQQYYTYLYFSQQYKKHLNLIVIVEGGGLIDRAVESALDRKVEAVKEIQITVNKEDWENPKYGTKENPIPVLKFTGIEKSIRKDNRDFDSVYMNKIYRETVRTYLTYIMSKEEFKKRFEKK